MNETPSTPSAPIERFRYDDAIVRKFVVATLIWGVVAMLVGVIIATQLAHWQLNLGLPWLSFGRLRPLHTNAAIFAFAGNAIFAGIYYSTQRLCKARMFHDGLSKLHFWGWQAIIVSAALTLPFGYTQGKEYAELAWPIDIAIALIWVVFGINFFGTIARRREKTMYVALWFYIATIITVAMLHIVNSIAIPTSWLESYPVYAGVQDALVQWWYGHNAVAFFLTTPFLGLMYYFMPKAVNGPIYSYRLSIIHFWSLVFIYIWAGPHHLLYTALPEWAQTLGMIFSVMLWAPSWGGMINGLLTLRGGWHRLRTEPVLKFFVAAVTLYGMSTFEGPLLSIKSVSSIAHYTDWIIAHVHGGALGWNGFLSFGMIYWLVPQLWKRKMHSERLIDLHFWMGSAGIVLYMLSMWTAGITQGMMWQAFNTDGSLQYPEFVQTVTQLIPLYWVRVVGGLLYLGGTLVGVYNLWSTMRAAQPGFATEPEVSAPAIRIHLQSEASKRTFHGLLEIMPTVFTVLTLIAVSIGGIIQIVPILTIQEYVKAPATFKPYTPLELAGRDIYVREGCYVCHSQMIRPLADEAVRYGAPSSAEESMYDRPFQWGSRRIGPDLARVGGKYPDLWHLRHMLDPREVVPTSIMPAYPWLLTRKRDDSRLERKLSVQAQLGAPYSEGEIKNAALLANRQAATIAAGLVKEGAPEGLENREITALIAYLQRLGKDRKTHDSTRIAPAFQTAPATEAK